MNIIDDCGVYPIRLILILYMHPKKFLAMARLKEDAVDVATIEFLDEITRARALHLQADKVFLLIYELPDDVPRIT